MKLPTPHDVADSGRRRLLGLLAAAVGVAVVVPACEQEQDRAEFLAPPPRNRHSDRFPDIVLHDQGGGSHRFYTDLVKDRAVIINFMYIACTGI